MAVPMVSSAEGGFNIYPTSCPNLGTLKLPQLDYMNAHGKWMQMGQQQGKCTEFVPCAVHRCPFSIGWLINEGSQVFSELSFVSWYVTLYSELFRRNWQWVDSDVEGSPAMWLEQSCVWMFCLPTFTLVQPQFIHTWILVYNSLIATVDDISMISPYAWLSFQHAAGVSSPGNWVRAQLVPPLSAGAKNLLVKVGWVVRRTCFEFKVFLRHLRKFWKIERILKNFKKL